MVVLRDLVMFYISLERLFESICTIQVLLKTSKIVTSLVNIASCMFSNFLVKV